MDSDNPFPKTDVRHKIREVLFQHAEEALAEVRERLLAKTGREHDLYSAGMEVFVGRFDADASAVCAGIGSYQAADLYAVALAQTVEEEMAWAMQWSGGLFPGRPFLDELRNRLLQRQAHWERLGRRYARESELRRLTAHDSPHAQSLTAGVSKQVKSQQFVSAKYSESAAQRAERRQAAVNPILARKRWTRGRLVTKAGVGKATVYGYLDGSRARISKDNRQANQGSRQSTDRS